MTDCTKYSNMISLYIDGQLPETEIYELNEHLKSCDSCASLLRLYESIFNSTHAYTEPPAELLPTVMKEIQNAKNVTLKKGRSKLKKYIASIAAIAACITVFLTAYIFPEKFDFGSIFNKYTISGSGPTAWQNDAAEAEVNSVQEFAKDNTSSDIYAADQDNGSYESENDSFPLMESSKDLNTSTALSKYSEFENYYAEVYIYSKLPDSLSEYEFNYYDENSYVSYVSAEMADVLCEEGYNVIYNSPAKFDGKDIDKDYKEFIGDTAVVIFTP